MDTAINELKHLDTDQLETFNREYADGVLWDNIINLIDSYFPTGEFTFLDIGGGNGVFTDKVLKHYPQSKAILLDNASNLIEINSKQPRKTIIMDSVENLEKYLKTYDVDIIFINWVLHHLVSNTYQKTKNNVVNVLKIIKQDKQVKYVAIFENMYNGALFDTLPGKLIYHLTSFKSIKILTRKMGANTAGTGVSFLSRKTWIKLFSSVFGDANFSIFDFGLWPVPVVRKIFLHIKSIHVSLFWIKNN